MKNKYFLLLLLAVLMASGVSAQRSKKVKVVPDTAQIVKNYLDSLTVLRKQLDSIRQVNSALRKESDDGRYYRLFAPTTFYHSGAQKEIGRAHV